MAGTVRGVPIERDVFSGSDCGTRTGCEKRVVSWMLAGFVSILRMSKRGNSGRGGESDSRVKRLAVDMGVSQETMAILHLLPNEEVEEPASTEQKRYFAVLVRQLGKQDEYSLAMRNELYESKSKMTEALSELKSSMAGTVIYMDYQSLCTFRSRKVYTSHGKLWRKFVKCITCDAYYVRTMYSRAKLLT